MGRAKLLYSTPVNQLNIMWWWRWSVGCCCYCSPDQPSLVTREQVVLSDQWGETGDCRHIIMEVLVKKSHNKMMRDLGSSASQDIPICTNWRSRIFHHLIFVSLWHKGSFNRFFLFIATQMPLRHCKKQEMLLLGGSASRIKYQS